MEAQRLGLASGREAVAVLQREVGHLPVSFLYFKSILDLNVHIVNHTQPVSATSNGDPLSLNEEVPCERRQGFCQRAAAS